MFKADKDPRKISLGVGAYRDDNGKPVVLPCVAEAERRIAGKSDHEYPPIQGLPEFNRLAAEFVYGANSPAIKEDRVAVCQALSGTGSLRLLGDFLKNVKGYNRVYIPNPTWPNHFGVFNAAGIPNEKYNYLDASNKLDINGILKTIKAASPDSAFLFHACAHNPTGVDPTKQQWKQISDAIKAAGCGVIFDCAYQGFASGDMEGDAYAIRLFVEEGHQVCLAQSFAKNFGLYGERCGAASVVCASKEEKERVVSQLKVAARTLWSNPPLYGARIVQTVLGDPKLKAQWYEECAGMAKRIISMRAALVENLKKAGSTRDWSHITSQIGMWRDASRSTTST
ncbi:hypothetical protein BLSTO_05712 [Blastocystis sp. subtype 1]